MYFKTVAGEYRAVRGSSKLEGYHPHLHKMFPGTGYSPDLGGSIAMLFNAQWSLERAAENGCGPAYGHSAPWLIGSLHGAVQPAWRYRLPEDLCVPATSAEQFGCDYTPPTPALAEAEFQHEHILDIDASDEEEDATLAAHMLATIAGVLSVQHCRECASDLAIACASLTQYTR